MLCMYTRFLLTQAFIHLWIMAFLSVKFSIFLFTSLTVLKSKRFRSQKLRRNLLMIIDQHQKNCCYDKICIVGRGEIQKRL